jgi:hypothetical protein
MIKSGRTTLAGHVARIERLKIHTFYSETLKGIDHLKARSTGENNNNIYL